MRRIEGIEGGLQCGELALPFGHRRLPVERLGDPPPGSVRRLRRKVCEREEPRLGDFAVGRARPALLEGADDIDRDMIPHGSSPVQIDAEQSGLSRDADVAFLPELLGERLFERFARLDTAPGICQPLT